MLWDGSLRFKSCVHSLQGKPLGHGAVCTHRQGSFCRRIDGSEWLKIRVRIVLVARVFASLRAGVAKSSFEIRESVLSI